MPYQIQSFAPDLNPLTPGILMEADGVYPSDNGIAAMPEPEAEIAALASDCLGVISFRTLSGNIRTIAGTQTKLYEVGLTGWADVSRAGDYTGSNNWRWHFAPWGNYLLAVNGSDAMQISTASGADFNDVGTGVPIARYITTLNNFVIMANFTDYASSTLEHRIAWSAIGSYSDWTPSLSTQAGYYDLVEVPGPITGIARVGNAVVVFKEQAIFLGTYVGAPYIWSFQLIQGLSGSVNQDSIIVTETGVLYFGIDDFYFFDGSQSKRIGTPVNDWFQSHVDRNYWGNMLGAYDPFKRICFWYFPTAADATGACKDSLIYDWRRGYWGRNVVTAQAALVHYSGDMTYDEIPSSYATYALIESSGLTYNSPFWGTYTFDTAIIDGSKQLCRYTGSPTDVTFTTGYFGDNGAVYRYNQIRPMFNDYPISATITPQTVAHIGDTSPTSWTAGTLSEYKADIRCSGRFTRFAFNVNGLFELSGLDVDSQKISKR